MKPLILATASVTGDENFLKLNRAYAEAVELSGGIVIIPDAAGVLNIQELLKASDGVLLTGGVDIDPFFFGEAPIKELGDVSPLRDAFEIELAKSAERINIPILAICRGIQVLNAALGGKVHQDIYCCVNGPLIKHSQDMPRHYPSHSVKISNASLLYNVFNSYEVRVNSFHHQAVSSPAACFRVTAVSPDGIIEAIEHTGMDFCLGVQWHPEAMIKKFPEQLGIFKEFIRAAQNNIKKRVK